MSKMLPRLLNALVMGALVLLLLEGCAAISAEQQFSQGNSLFKQGRYVAAHQHALKAYAAEPGVVKYTSLLAWTYLKQGNVAQAERLFISLSKEHNGSLAALQGLAWVDYTKGRLPQAQRGFDRQLQRAQQYTQRSDWQAFSTADSDYILSCLSDGEYGLGLIAVREKRYPAARQHFTRALAHRNDFIGHGPILVALGNTYYYRGEYSKALDYFRQASREENDANATLKLGWCFYNMGQIGKAQQTFQEGLRRAADARPWLYGLAFTDLAQNQIPQAKARFEQLIRLDPAYADIPAVRRLIVKHRGWRSLDKDFAQAYIARGEFGKARGKLNHYLPFARRDHEARIMQAWCKVYLHQLPGALREFTGLSRLRGPVGTQAVLGKGVALLYLGRLNEADRAFEEVVSRDPHNTRAKVARGAVAYLKKDWPRAIHIYTAHLDQLPAKELYFSWPSWALNNLGWCYIYTGDYAAALQTFQRLAAYYPYPVYPLVYNDLGWAYLHLGRSGEAKQEFAEALRLAPHYRSPRIGLARLSGSTSTN